MRKYQKFAKNSEFVWKHEYSISSYIDSVLQNQKYQKELKVFKRNQKFLKRTNST